MISGRNMVDLWKVYTEKAGKNKAVENFVENGWQKALYISLSFSKKKKYKYKLIRKLIGHIIILLY
jgi:hypothetical protein